MAELPPIVQGTIVEGATLALGTAPTVHDGYAEAGPSDGYTAHQNKKARTQQSFAVMGVAKLGSGLRLTPQQMGYGSNPSGMGNYPVLAPVGDPVWEEPMPEGVALPTVLGLTPRQTGPPRQPYRDYPVGVPQGDSRHIDETHIGEETHAVVMSDSATTYTSWNWEDYSYAAVEASTVRHAPCVLQ